jgi:putative redox protein
LGHELVRARGGGRHSHELHAARHRAGGRGQARRQRTGGSDAGGETSRVLDHAREIGVIRNQAFPPDIEAWTRELRETRPLSLVAKLAPRPLLLVQGSDDDVVPSVDARALADCHGSAELRIISGAGHRLRHDPRAVAVLLGWLERQADAAVA